MCFPQVMGEVHLRVRTCAPFSISREPLRAHCAEIRWAVSDSVAMRLSKSFLGQLCTWARA